MTDLVQNLRYLDQEFGFSIGTTGADRIEQLEKALALCRTAMPIPDGGELEQLWSEAVSDADAVPTYVEASVAYLKAEILEQCRINGMSAEREIALIAKVERLERENAELVKDAKRYRWLRNADMDQRNRAEHYAESALDVFVDSAMKENK